jgi:hypothetical protein
MAHSLSAAILPSLAKARRAPAVGSKNHPRCLALLITNPCSFISRGCLARLAIVMGPSRGHKQNPPPTGPPAFATFRSIVEFSLAARLAFWTPGHPLTTGRFLYSAGRAWSTLGSACLGRKMNKRSVAEHYRSVTETPPGRPYRYWPGYLLDRWSLVSSGGATSSRASPGPRVSPVHDRAVRRAVILAECLSPSPLPEITDP